MTACAYCSAALEPAARFCGQCGTLAHDDGDQSSDWLGRIVDGRYKVVARLGAGGMGVVYRVEHLHLGKMAAMKVLAPETAGKPEMVRRFRTEAQAVSRLDHPNIVQTFDFGQHDGAFYLVMEYVKGDDLAAVLRREGPWSFGRAARLFLQVCSGLSEAHDAGIVHRDLKPENLMVVSRRDGTEHVKVLDFGLAKLRERVTDPYATAVSSESQVLGTPLYMAPEQVRGEPLDARADLYSLGAALYRVLTGVPPFEAPSPMSVLAKHLTEPVVPPRDRAPDRALPPEADRIVLRAMAKSPADRYQTAAELRADLEQALGETSLSDSTWVPPPIALASLAGSPTSEAPTVAIDDSDIVEAEDRLRRSDVDEFEWGLRRRRLARRLLLPVAAAAAIAGAVLLIQRYGGDRPDVVEHEPNNTPGYANLLPQGVPVRGTIGKLNADGTGDVDFFRVPAGKGTRLLDARLEGIPNVDLVLEVYDSLGQRLAKSDAHGRGWGEWLQPTSIGPAEVYLAVRELWVQGTPPTADAAEPYALTVHWGPAQPGWELEPNDRPAAATAITAPTRVRGYLGSPEDRDWYAIAVGTAGRLTGTVTAPAGVDVMLLRDPNDRRTIIDRHGAGESEDFSIEAKPGTPVLIGVARQLAPTADSKQPPLQGLDDPYEVAVTVAPAK